MAAEADMKKKSMELVQLGRTCRRATQTVFTRVLHRSFAGSRAVYIVCAAAREALCAGSAGLTWVPCHARTLLISCDARWIPDSVHQKAMWLNWLRASHSLAATQTIFTESSQREGPPRLPWPLLLPSWHCSSDCR